MDKILKKLTFGHYIVTTRKPSEEMSTRDKDYLAAGTVNWVTQLSIDPVRIGIGIQLHHDLNETIEKSRNFTVHILEEGQENLVKQFSKDSSITSEKINQIGFEIGENGAPLLSKGIGYIECKVVDRLTIGDHSLFVGEVVAHDLINDAMPLCTMQTGMIYEG